MVDFVTPITEIESYYNNNIYIKREDLIPFSFGGNKVRIAQEYFADMEARGKNCLIGYGNTRSNLCRVLANLSFSKGKVCHIISPADNDGTQIETNNSYIVHSCGAVLHTATKQNVAEIVQSVIESCVSEGLDPYYIYGDKSGTGNKAVPVRAYVPVYQEIRKQEEELGFCFDYIFLAAGTGMTQSGLLAGANLYAERKTIIGISIARKQVQEELFIKQYLEAYFYDRGIPLNMTSDICINDDYLCGGYGKYTDNIKNTICSMFKKEGIPLDLTYTGKAFYGMTDYIQKNQIRGKKILFIHTGGTPLFFDNISITVQ